MVPKKGPVRERLAMCLGRELDLQIQLGAPRSREEAGAARSTQTRSEKRALKAQLNPPKATDRPPEGADSSLLAAIDMTGDPS